MKIRLVGAELSHAEGRTDRFEANGFFFGCNFATAPNKFLKVGYRENFRRLQGPGKSIQSVPSLTNRALMLNNGH